MRVEPQYALKVPKGQDGDDVTVHFHSKISETIK